MTQRIHESGRMAPDAVTKTLRVCLIEEGIGSSADFPREFFVQSNADALAGSLSFPAHPMDVEHPEHRDPMSAIGSIGEKVTIEEHEGKLSFWGEYIPAKSKPQVAEYLQEFGHRLGLSVYGDSDGHRSESGKWIAESLDGSDPYKSVDLVVAAGRGGKFERVAESLGLIEKTSATAEEVNEETNMEKIDEVVTNLSKLTVVVESLVSKLDGKAKADLQVEADTTAVTKAVEGRLVDYDKSVGLISEAKLTESQSASLRGLALKGTTSEQILPLIEDAKKVLAEAKAVVGDDEDETSGKVVEHLGSTKKSDDFDPFDLAPGFGKVS